MAQSSTGSPLTDVEFLARSEHRVAALQALAERPRSRHELRALTGASASTISRMLREFENRRWIERDGQSYETTELGAFVATGVTNLIERLETERRLRIVWEWLPDEVREFTVEIGSDAVVTVAETDDPYRPVHRFVSLLRETDRFRFVGSDLALLEPCKDEFRDRVVDGMRTEIIDPPSVARYVLSTYRDHCAEPLESGNLTVLVHDELPPYGVSLFDHRIAISCHNPVNGTVQAVIDSDAPAAREWAEATFDSFRRDARPLSIDPIVE